MKRVGKFERFERRKNNNMIYAEENVVYNKFGGEEYFALKVIKAN
jgi:hypothetical protein